MSGQFESVKTVRVFGDGFVHLRYRCSLIHEPAWMDAEIKLQSSRRQGVITGERAEPGMKVDLLSDQRGDGVGRAESVPESSSELRSAPIDHQDVAS